MKTIAQLSTKALLSKESGVPEREYELECECVLHLGSDRCRFTIYYGNIECAHILVKRFNKEEISIYTFDSFEEAVRMMAFRSIRLW